MKKLILTACAVFATSFAFAQSNNDVTTQLGNGNSAQVDQVGAVNDNSIMQQGDDNIAKTDQNGIGNMNESESYGKS